MGEAKLSERDKGTDKQERRGKYRYNRKYERCMTEEIPEWGERKKNVWNEERENRFG
jgi:hypothetical protein